MLQASSSKVPWTKEQKKVAYAEKRERDALGLLTANEVEYQDRN